VGRGGSPGFLKILTHNPPRTDISFLDPDSQKITKNQDIWGGAVGQVFAHPYVQGRGLSATQKSSSTKGLQHNIEELNRKRA
jgi:hypothetical protein